MAWFCIGVPGGPFIGIAPGAAAFDAGASIGAPAGSFSSVRPLLEAKMAERGNTLINFQLLSGSVAPSRTRTSWLSSSLLG